MFDGMVEDGLIAHTFAEFVKTGDATWPLLLPMAKSAVEAMTAAQQIAQPTAGGSRSTASCTTGASKRGWTTWLSAAIDDRVMGLVPMVIDMLSLERACRPADEVLRRASRSSSATTPRGASSSCSARPAAASSSASSIPIRLPRPARAAEDHRPGHQRSLLAARSLRPLLRPASPGPAGSPTPPTPGTGCRRTGVRGLVAAMGRHAAGLEPLPEVALDLRSPTVAAASAASTCRAARACKVVAWRTQPLRRDFRRAHAGPRRVPSGMARAGGSRSRGPPAGYAAGLLEFHFPGSPCRCC